MSIKEKENANATKANATIGNVYSIHTNKYIEHLLNKPTTTSMRDRQVWECILAIEFLKKRKHELSTQRTFV